MTAEWAVVAETDERTEWERRDGFVRVVVRRTVGGEWAATLDALEQAAEGPAYERATLATRDDAEARAASWRDRYDSA